MESESSSKKSKKILILASLAILVALIFIMTKLFIFDTINSNEKPYFGQNKKVDLNEGAFTKGAQSGNAASNTSQNSQNPNKNNPAPTQTETETETPPTNKEAPPASKENPASNTENQDKTATPSQSDKFIAKSPIDVLKIRKISKFRSCANEAFGKTTLNNQKEEDSSLLHNFKLKESSVSISAPFDGKVIYKDADKIAIEISPFNGWTMNIFGINPKTSLSKDSEIKSGDEIGTSSGSSVKISMSGYPKSQKNEAFSTYSTNNLDSFFNHLNDSVSTEFSGKGASTSTLIVEKTTRDSNKCKFKPDNEEDWVSLK